MTSYERKGLLFILVGPTGAGKNTIMNHVLNRLEDIKQLPTATTRPIRPTEKEGREHHFVTLTEFEQMIDKGELLEYENVHGRMYGVPRKIVADAIEARFDRIADIDVLGAMNVRTAFPDNTIIIFVQPGSSDDVVGTIRTRLEQRGENQAEIENRLQRIPLEMSYAPQCDYLVMNDELDHAIEVTLGIILAERSRRDLINLRARNTPRHHRLVQMSIIIVTDDNQLLQHDGQVPSAAIIPGEYPHEALARRLPYDLMTDITQEQLLGITTQTEEPDDRIVFWYHHKVSQPNPSLPNGWRWKAVTEQQLPDSIQIQLTRRLT